jgi:hypothetical protein
VACRTSARRENVPAAGKAVRFRGILGVRVQISGGDLVEDQQVGAEGRLERMDDAGFRRLYGTEWALIDEEAGKVSYALKSDTEDLEEYVGQHPRLFGFLVEGFPAGAEDPGYISVMRIDEAYYSE